MTTFRYFADPHTSSASTWSDEPGECGICVCEGCLESGRLAERELTTNNGDVGPSDERRAELEQRTPNLVTWQDVLWPVHCDDFCRFEREVGKRELDELSPNGDGVAYLNAHLSKDLSASPLDEDELPPHGPMERGDSGDPAVYQFACVVCGEHVFRWDAS